MRVDLDRLSRLRMCPQVAHELDRTPYLLGTQRVADPGFVGLPAERLERRFHIGCFDLFVSGLPDECRERLTECFYRQPLLLLEVLLLCIPVEVESQLELH